MNISYARYAFNYSLENGTIHVISIENQVMLRDVLNNVWKQSNGEIGEIIISEREREISLEKKFCVIMNPFSLNCNEKKVLTKLYKELQEIVQENLLDELELINREVIALLDNLLSSVPYNLECALDMDILGLFKLYNIYLSTEAETFLEGIINYIKVMHQICQTEHYILFNLRQYLSDEELKLFYEFVAYEHITCIILEGQYLGRKSELETCMIVDQDLCIIRP